MKTFDFSRFKKVLVYDLKGTYKMYGLSMLIIILLPAMMWLLQLALGGISNEVPTHLRWNLIIFATTLAAAIAPMKKYGSCNVSGKGNYFALLPASLGEKFCSMMLYCFILIPLVVFVGLIADDTLLSILPWGSYKHNFIWQGEGDYFEFSNFVSFGGFRNTLLLLVSITSTSSLFMFTNTIFKTNKFIKTVLWLLLISFILTIILIPILTHINWNMAWLRWINGLLENMTKRQFVNLFFWFCFGFNLLVTALLSFFAYRRLRKMQY